MGYMQKKISGIQTGVAGEYFVAAELSRRGYLCSITLKNTKGIDILVSNENSSKLVGIQVKTNNSSRKAWLLSKFSEKLQDKNIIYVFVNLGDLNNIPTYYIAGSHDVAKSIKKDHCKWLKAPGKKGQQHNDCEMRMFRDEKDKHKNAWHIIENALTIN